MSTNITAVSVFQSYFQSLPEPSKLPMTLVGLAIGIGIGEFVRRMIVQWKAKDRLIAKLRAENDYHRWHIGRIQVPVFGFEHWQEPAGQEQQIEELRKLYEPEAGDGEPSKQPLVVQDESWDLLKQLPPLSLFDVADQDDIVTGQRWTPPCDLPATGQRWTPTEVAEWAQAFVTYAKSRIGDGPVVGHLWAYRYPEGAAGTGSEHLVVGFWNAENRARDPSAYMDLAFLIGGSAKYRFHLDEPSAADAAEAIHRIGLVAAALRATMTIGMIRPCEESNAVVAEGPWFWRADESK